MAKQWAPISARVRATIPTEMHEATKHEIAEAKLILDLALAVWNARAAAGLTQTQLAVKAGITQAELSRIENGIYAPRIATLGKLAAALQTQFVIGVTEQPEAA